jgi:cytosine permease
MASLPDYVMAARPVPQENRAAWYKNTAQTYAGIMLWFVFWQDVVSGSPTPGGSLSAGLGIALVALLVAALFCHFLTYLVPGLLGMKTGLPLYVVGTSTYGVHGGFIMPGFLMGALQFGWLAVNAFFSCWALCVCLEIGLDDAGKVIVPGYVHGGMSIAFIFLAVLVGLKGIGYVARVATFVPLIPLVILLILFVKTAPGLANFSSQKLVTMNTDVMGPAALPMTVYAVFLFLSTYVVGFFATAGAAGADFGMNNRNGSDVQLGGLTGIVGATVFAGGVAMLVVAGAYGAGLVPSNIAELNPVKLMEVIVGKNGGKAMLALLAAASFAPACFPAFIAANSFRTTMPKFGMVAVVIGTLASIALAVFGWAGQAVDVFKVVGASFGPICGAMTADYLLAGRKWAGPRAGFNPAGWISWAVGFYLGSCDLVADKGAALLPQLASLRLDVPCPPMTALVAGFVLYFILAAVGLTSRKLEMPGTAVAAETAPPSEN